MKFQIMSTFWGEMHLDWFKRGCFESLSWTENRRAILDNCSTWNINTDEANFPQIMEIFEECFPELKVKLRKTEELRKYIDHLQSALVTQVESCLEEKERFLFAPPDTIFSDGAVANLMKLGREPGTCVAVAHPRVLPDILDDIQTDQYTITSDRLVTKAWKHLHQSWADAESGHPRQNSFIGGVRWEKLSEKIYAITHHLPTPYFCDFTPEDLAYFKTRVSFGSYDHEWPSDLLIRQGRQRFIGSSDAGFICEITERLKNIPPVKPGPVDGFWREHAHNFQNRQTTIIFRGE